MRRGKDFKKDFKIATELFPKLRANWNLKHESWHINGQLDICDEVGDYWGSFDVHITVPQSYPYCVPVVKEVSRRIKRDVNWHISKEGICCIDIDHKMLFLAVRGINIRDFIRSLVYPYFANQLYRIKKGKYAGEEFKHYFEGVRQFYSEHLDIHDAGTAILMLEAILQGLIPDRNKKCLCGKPKIKKCHLSSVEFLRDLPQERLKTDLNEFRKIAAEIGEK
ncbi:hypothetical protein C900_04158 [Fulvivirga imtechensis AK7]|uniref:SEC-C motif domain protein n=1 Tax=Fulvivirga imtechensis AK7 TaxID=1237149 RepID=L8JWA2_9BACT|nr:hypothetical protein [Fulvivirga imtechensis]ELR73306.1 hypothetical protein C900_04158 [Fulvivirga imtechensis AK7]